MKRFSLGLALSFGLILVAMGAALADTKVTLTEMHICCGGCTKGIQAAVKDLAGVKVDVDSDSQECTVTGDTAEAVQKAVDAIVGAGYHAKADNAAIKIADDSGAKAGNVQRLTVTNAHNCCGACTRAIKEAIGGVAGVKADTCKAKEASFVVEGDFDAQALVKALNDAGFHVTVK